MSLQDHHQDPSAFPEPVSEDYDNKFEEKLDASIDDIEVQDSNNSIISDDIMEIPKIVREVITTDDDPTEPTLTFRFWVLSVIFILPGAFLDTMNSYRTTSAAYSIFFVQICSYWLGKWMARTLPNKVVSFGRLGSFKLNPGPFSIKENVLITLAAASGATGNQGTTPVSLAEVFYGTKVHPAVAIFYMWSINLGGYALSYIARNVLIYDPQFIWPQALMQTTLFNSMKKTNEGKRDSRKQMKVFFFCVIGMTIWEFLPEYVFPMVSSLSFICWVAPENAVANFIGGGMGGMGFLSQSLDWSNITSSVLLSPYWTQCVQFAAFVFGAWVLLPAAKWGNLGSFKHGLMSNGLFTEAGKKYPATELLIYDNGVTRFNETAYQEIGPIYIGTQKAWNMFFDCASFTSAFSWILLFGWGTIAASWGKLRQRMFDNKNINHLYTDRLNKIQASYPEVPFTWFFGLFLCTFVVLMTIFATGSMFIPWWTYPIALAIGCLIILPLSYLYAISNFQLAIGTFNELIYGAMVQYSRHGKHPASATTYGGLSGDLWYRAQYVLQDQKIGHYMHIPPKAVFISQVFGTLIGVPMNYGAVRWILNTKFDFINGTKKDPLGQWTGQSLSSYNTNAVLYVLLGPTRFFSTGDNKVIPFGFLFGAVAPLAIYALYKLFPRGKFQYWNVTIFCSTMSNFYGNLSTGYTTAFLVGTFSMYYLYNFKHMVWQRYNYIVGAAFDTGYNLAVLLIFIIFSSGTVISMPNWWGNNAVSVERCFALD